jgi:hypothetical protein
MVKRLLALVVFLFLTTSSTALAAVAQVNSYSNAGSGTTNTVTSVAIASGEIAIVSSSWRQSGAITITGVTFNGSSSGVTLIGSSTVDTSGGEGRQGSYIINGVTGTANVVVTLSAGTVSINTQVRVFSGVDPGSPIGTVVSASGDVATVTVDASSASGNMVMDNVVYRSAAALTIGASKTNEIEIGLGGSVSLHGSIETGATTVTMSWTGGDGGEWAIVAIPLVAGGGGGGATNGPKCLLVGVC